MDNKIVCIAEFIAKEDKINELKAALNSLLKPTKNEEGCVSYELHQALDNPYKFTMIEKYKDQAAFDFHINQPYLLQFKKNRKALVKSLVGTLYKIVGPDTNEN